MPLQMKIFSINLARNADNKSGFRGEWAKKWPSGQPKISDNVMPRKVLHG